MRISDWSSDVCSSDLVVAAAAGERLGMAGPQAGLEMLLPDQRQAAAEDRAALVVAVIGVTAIEIHAQPVGQVLGHGDIQAVDLAGADIERPEQGAVGGAVGFLAVALFAIEAIAGAHFAIAEREGLAQDPAQPIGK